MAHLPDIRVPLKILSSEYQRYACGKNFARLDFDRICRFPDGPWL